MNLLIIKRKANKYMCIYAVMERPIEPISKCKNKHLSEGGAKVGRLQRNPDASFVSGVTTPEKTFRCLPNLEGAFCTSSSMRQEGLTRDEGGRVRSSERM